MAMSRDGSRRIKILFCSAISISYGLVWVRSWKMLF